MKKIWILLLLAVTTVTLSSCGKRMYATSSAGKDNVSYVTVVSDSERYENVWVVVDGTEFLYGKLEKSKNRRKALPLEITPGKHRVEVVINGQTVASEEIFIGLQETKRFVVR